VTDKWMPLEHTSMIARIAVLTHGGHDRPVTSRARTERGSAAVSPAADGNAARERDDVPPIVVPHWRDCQPRRPARWVRHAPRRDAGTTMRPRSVEEGWRGGRLRTDPHGRPMRINMTYNNSFITSADFSPKIGQDVFGEAQRSISVAEICERNSWSARRLKWQVLEFADARTETGWKRDVIEGSGLLTS
jgi:hypothetical protein